jgi:uncharacterized membrane protein YfcA
METLLIPIGLIVGILAGMLGIGGGFLYVPALLLLPLSADHALATGTSHGAILIAAISGSVAFYRQRRQDWVLAAAFSVTAIPGAFVGKWINSEFSTERFQFAFALLMIASASWMLFGKEKKDLKPGDTVMGGFGCRSRRVVDRMDRTWDYRVNLVVAGAGALFIGAVAGTFGVGGGILMVPFMILLLGVPLEVAIPTSLLTICTISATSTLAFGMAGQVQALWVTYLGVGGIAGAQLGSRLAEKANPLILKRILVAIMLLAAGELLRKSFFLNP